MFTAIELVTLDAGTHFSGKFSLVCCFTKATLFSEICSLKCKDIESKRLSLVVLLEAELLAQASSSQSEPIRDLAMGIKPSHTCFNSQKVENLELPWLLDRAAHAGFP